MPKSSKRKGYHHGDLRRALLDAAVTLIAERGVHGLSLREAARRADVSSGAPYRHFEDKEALLVAIAEEGEDLFAGFVREELALNDDDDPLAQFRAHGIAFVTFAAAHPIHFRLMCSGDIAAHRDEHVGDDATLIGLISQRAELAATADTIALAGRSLAYGLARMIVDGQLPDIDRDPLAVRELAVRVLDVFGMGLAATSPGS